MISESGKLLFKQALIDFRLNPETHRQEEWICRTGCCIAGSIALQSGATPDWAAASSGTSMVILDGGGTDTVSGVAMRALGIAPGDAKILFHPFNTIDDLEVMYGLLDAGHRLGGPWCWDCNIPRLTDEAFAAMPYWRGSCGACHR